MSLLTNCHNVSQLASVSERVMLQEIRFSKKQHDGSPDSLIVGIISFGYFELMVFTLSQAKIFNPISFRYLWYCKCVKSEIPQSAVLTAYKLNAIRSSRDLKRL